MLVMAMLTITSLAFAGGGQVCETHRGDGAGTTSTHHENANLWWDD